MKILLIASLLLIPSLSFSAWKVEGNPDEYASIALGYSTGEIDGIRNLGLTLFTNVPGVFAFGNGAVESETKIRSITPSFRVPINSNLTIDFGLTLHKESYQNSTQGFTWDGTLKGKIFSIGARWYLK